ncbi:MAG: ABC transporter permease [Bacteroidota bacterium]|jgi:putative ABC transport system permease protein
MISNYLKAAFRNLWMHKGYSFINIAGLSIGLASSFIIMLYSLNELGYDRFNTNLDRIFLVTTENPDLKWTEPSTPFVLGPALKDQFPQVEQFARWMKSFCPFKYKDRSFDNVACISSDTSIFKILTLPLKEGSLRNISAERNFAVISSEMAQKVFGDRDPIGEIITVNWRGESYDLKVSAVMLDIPRTSTFRADLIVPLSIGEKWMSTNWSKFVKDPLESWNLKIAPTYVLLTPSSVASDLENQLASFSNAHTDANIKSRFHLLPLKEIYFRSSGFVNNRFPAGDITNVYVYSTIAILILLVACINFVILSTGRASVRTKEIAVRKVIGATRFDLMKQVMMESVMVSLLSLPVALLLVELFLPSLSRLLGRALPASSFHNLNSLFLFAGVTLVAGILAGSYVSFYLSGFRPMDILRNKLSTGGSKATLRKIMIAIQMVIFVGLITASITIYQQVRYFHNKDMGFDKEDLLVFSTENRNLGQTLETFKAELKSDPSITDVSGTYLLPGSGGGGFSMVPDKSDPTKKISYQGVSVDRDFIETMKMKLVYGKSFAQSTLEESKSAVILNESAVKVFGVVDPSQELVNGQRILGIVKDFNMHSLREAIAPIVINCSTEFVMEIAVRVRHSSDVSKTVSLIESKSKPFNNGKPMEYQFFDDRLDDLYGNDYRFAEMIGCFTALAIVIACLGLFGVSLFVIQTRVKEIGIRKVMGASVGTIFYLVAKEFIALILIATIVSTPITIYFMNGWLQHYAYKVSVDAFVVIFALLAAVCIVLVTIGYQAIKAATANPVEALRYE